MAKLIYMAMSSLDGFVADERGNFDWCAPDDEVHAFVNDLLRPLGTHLYGRRMYEVMRYWETAPTEGGARAVERDFASLWQAADKVVYSKTLESVSSKKTRIERTFDAETIRRLKTNAARDSSIGGPEIAAHAFKAELIDECHLFFSPVIVGGGKRSLPDGVFLKLKLLNERRFQGGTLYLHYRAAR
jgi:dihydrofolate reductase